MAALNVTSAGAQPPLKPEYTNPEIEAAKAAPDFAEKVSRFQALADTVTDTSGKFSDEQKLQAYVSVVEMSVTGQLKGMGREGMARADEVYFGEFGKKVQQLQADQATAVMGAGLTGDGPAAAKAALAYFDGLSASDQSIFFQTGVNPALRDGRTFTSVQGWRDNMNAAIKLGEYTQENRDLIASGATTKAGDPKFEAALRLGAAADAGSASWSSMVLKLFEGPKDKVDLSDGARRLVGDSKDVPRPNTQYQEGSIASKTV